MTETIAPQDGRTWEVTVPVPTVGLRRVTVAAPHVPHPDLAGPRGYMNEMLHGAAKVADAVYDATG